MLDPDPESETVKTKRLHNTGCGQQFFLHFDPEDSDTQMGFP
jgi:hypothetical protein